MIFIEKVETYGFKEAIRGMHNYKNSWDRSDSVFCFRYGCADCDYEVKCRNSKIKWDADDVGVGVNDLRLMKQLVKDGSESRKYLEMINVYMDITAPLYFWNEFDTYKIGTVVNSCSIMHNIRTKKFTLDDFSHEHLFNGFTIDKKVHCKFREYLEHTIFALNVARDLYLKTENEDYWYQMIQLLPSSYNQKRTVMMNYETVLNIIRQRENNELDEWETLVDKLKTLPLIEYLLGD